MTGEGVKLLKDTRLQGIQRALARTGLFLQHAVELTKDLRRTSLEHIQTGTASL